MRKDLRDSLALPLTLPRPMRWQGARSLAFQAQEGKGRPLVIKLPTQRDSVALEAWVYRALGRAGIPVPEVRACRATLPRLGLPCLVMSMIEGEPLFAQRPGTDGEQDLYGGIGALLARIHAVALPRVLYGLGAFVPGRSGASHGSWQGFMAAYHAHPRSAQYLLAQGLLPGVTGEDIGLLGDALAGHCFDAVLNHGDFGPDHVLVRDGRIAGVIDAGQAFAGPAEYDLGYLACYLSGPQFGHVLQAYGGRVEQDKIYLYMAVIAMHKAARAGHAGQAQRARDFSAIACAAWSQLRAQHLI